MMRKVIVLSSMAVLFLQAGAGFSEEGRMVLVGPADNLRLIPADGRVPEDLPNDERPAPRSVTSAAIVGTAKFNYQVNYSGTPALYYTVTGGPPNTCGELNAYRNGSWIYGANWLCTDSSGNATKGPWTWANTPTDQTDEPAYIRWPDGSTTNNATHVWDKSCASTFRTSAAPTNGLSPLSYSGYATDAQWGAGFDFNPSAVSYFMDQTTALFWRPGLSGYTSPSSVPYATATLSRVNRWRVNWSAQFPPPSAHIPGHSYMWFTCVTDGGCGNCTSNMIFTVQ